MPEPRSKINRIAQNLDKAGLLSDLKAAATTPPVTTPEAPSAARSRYDIIDGDQESIKSAVKNIQDVFGITKPIKLPSEDYTATRKTINNLVSALQQFQAKGKKLDPAIGFDFGTGIDRVDSDVTPDKVVMMYAGSSTEKILQVLETVHQSWAEQAGTGPEIVTIFDRAKAIKDLEENYLFVAKIQLDGSVTDDDLETTINTLKEALSDPGIEELIEDAYRRPMAIFIGHGASLEKRQNRLIIPAKYEDAEGFRQFIRDNINKFEKVTGPVPDKYRLDLDASGEEEGEDAAAASVAPPAPEAVPAPPPEPPFNPAAAIESLKGKYNVASIKLEEGIPEAEVEDFLKKLDEILGQITDLDQALPLNINIVKEKGKLSYHVSGNIKIGRGVDLNSLLARANGNIEELKKAKNENEQAKSLAAELKGKYRLAEVKHYTGWGELETLKKLEAVLEDFDNKEALRGMTIAFNSTEHKTWSESNLIKMHYQASQDEMEYYLEAFVQEIADKKESEANAALDALLAGDLGENLTELQEVSSPETEPIPGRMYQDRQGNLFIVREAPNAEGDFTMLNISQGYHEFSNTKDFSPKVTGKQLELVQASKVDLGQVDRGRAMRMENIKVDTPSSVRRPEHQDYWIADAQEDFTEQQNKIKQKISSQKAITPEDIENLYRAQQKVGIMRQIRQEIRLDSSASHIVYYRESNGHVYTRQEALSRMNTEIGMRPSDTLEQRQEALGRLKREELEIAAKVASSRERSPEYLWYTEQLSYNQLLQQKLVEVINRPDTPADTEWDDPYSTPPPTPDPTRPSPSTIPEPRPWYDDVFTPDPTKPAPATPTPEPASQVPEAERVFPSGKGFSELKQELSPARIDQLKEVITAHVKSLGMGVALEIRGYVKARASEFEKLGYIVTESLEVITAAKQRFIQAKDLHNKELGDHFEKLLKAEHALVYRIDTILNDPLPHFNNQESAQKLLAKTIPQIIADTRRLTGDYKFIGDQADYLSTESENYYITTYQELKTALENYQQENINPEELKEKGEGISQDMVDLNNVKNKKKLKDPKKWKEFTKRRAVLIGKWESRVKKWYQRGSDFVGLNSEYYLAHQKLTENKRRLDDFINGKTSYLTMTPEQLDKPWNSSLINLDNRNLSRLLDNFNRSQEDSQETLRKLEVFAAEVAELKLMINE